MIIKVLLKSISKTRGVEYLDYNVLDNIVTLKDLILNLCDIEIKKYENKEFKVLSQEDINTMVNTGKISFGFKYREDVIDRQKAYENALLSFEDGLYRVFINDKEIKELNAKINLKQNDTLALIRLTMMTGWFTY